MRMREHWVKKVKDLAEESRLIPMWGNVPHFPLEDFINALRQSLKIEDLDLSIESSDWVEYENILQGLGEHPTVLSLTMSPLTPSFFCALAKEDVAKLSSLMLDQNGKWNFADPDYQKGFFRYCFLNVIQAFDALKAYDDLSPKLNHQGMPKERAYCINAQLKVQDQTLHIKIVLPESFHKILSSHFATKPYSLDHIEGVVNVPLSIQAGYVEMPLNDLLSAQMGDFVILDQCSYHPSEKKGVYQLCMEDTPIFVIQSKHGKTSVLDYALVENIQTEEGFMMEDFKDEEDDFEEDEFIPDEDAEEDEEDFEDDEDEDYEFEDDEDEDEEPEDSSEKNESVSQVISTKEIPLAVKVEVGRVKMPLKKLLSLKPGNTLELDAEFPQVVNLTVDSQVIGKGELVQLGDLVGVKISEIYH